MVNNMMNLQSVEEARPVKASDVGEKMDGQETQVIFLKIGKLFTNLIHFYT